MSYNPHPSAYFPNCIINTTGIFIPFTDFESYNSDTSGDIRQLSYSFLDAVASTYLSLSSTDKPSQINISRSYQAISDSSINKSYVYSFNLSFSGVSVANE